MDSAAMAAQSDPVRNRQFARPWTGPPRSRERPGPHHQPRPILKLQNANTSIVNRAEASAQRAIRHAVRRVAEIERKAEIAAAVGLRDAADRLRAIAADIRAEVLS